MGLVIHHRANAAAGLKRYNGRGIYSSIGRKALLIVLKKVPANTIENKKGPAGGKRKLTEHPPHPSSSSQQSLPKARKYYTLSTDKLVKKGEGINLG